MSREKPQQFASPSPELLCHRVRWGRALQGITGIWSGLPVCGAQGSACGDWVSPAGPGSSGSVTGQLRDPEYIKLSDLAFKKLLLWRSCPYPATSTAEK